MKTRYCILFFLTCLLSCNSTNREEISDDDILRIKVFPTKENVSYVYASEVISAIEYIPLETADQCLIGESFRIGISDNYIIINANPDCLLFSRQGKFIRKIGSKGQGPKEYIYPSWLEIDEKSGMIYLSSFEELLAYRITGEFVKKINIPRFRQTAGISGSLNEIRHWKDDLFCAGISLDSGKEPYDFVIFSLDGQVVKLFPNHITFKKEPEGWSRSSPRNLYMYDGLMSFREQYSDTLFRLNDRMEFFPAVVFDLMGRKMPTELRGGKGNLRDLPYTYISLIWELENYILLDCDFSTLTLKGMPPPPNKQFCLYDKKNHKLTVLKRDLLYQESVPPPSGVLTDGKEQIVNYFSRGFINDIDGGCDFGWNQMARIPSTHQVFCGYRHAYKLLKDLTPEHFAAQTIRDKEAHERLKKLLANLKNDDNPVLMIATFK